MKNLILAIIFIFTTSTIALSAPFLVCDPPTAEEQVTGYEVFQDGVSIGTTAAPLHFDLQGISPGAYNFTAVAINAWGSSSPSNPYVSPAAADTPSGLTMDK